jgi:type IV secretion system protein TrbL
VAFFTNFIQIFVLCLSWLIVLAAFFILAVQLFVALIEFKLTTLAGFVLIPFALFNRTAFLAEKVLGNVVSSGVKIMVLAVISAIASVLFKQFTTSYGSRAHHRAGDLGGAGLARNRRPVHLWRQHRQWADLRRAPAWCRGSCREPAWRWARWVLLLLRPRSRASGGAQPSVRRPLPRAEGPRSRGATSAYSAGLLAHLVARAAWPPDRRHGPGRRGNVANAAKGAASRRLIAEGKLCRRWTLGARGCDGRRGEEAMAIRDGGVPARPAAEVIRRACR